MIIKSLRIKLTQIKIFLLVSTLVTLALGTSVKSIHAVPKTSENDMLLAEGIPPYCDISDFDEVTDEIPQAFFTEFASNAYYNVLVA